MASQMKWSTPTTAACAISTAMNSLADSANASGAGISPSGYLYGDWEIYCGFTGSVKANGYVSLWLLPSIDGTNYADGNGTVDPSVTPNANFPLRAVSGSQRILQTHIQLPSGSFVPLVTSESGCAMAAVGNILRYSFFTIEQV